MALITHFTNVHQRMTVTWVPRYMWYTTSILSKNWLQICCNFVCCLSNILLRAFLPYIHMFQTKPYWYSWKVNHVDVWGIDCLCVRVCLQLLKWEVNVMWVIYSSCFHIYSKFSQFLFKSSFEYKRNPQVGIWWSW